jgi:hypothetical protein
MVQAEGAILRLHRNPTDKSTMAHGQQQKQQLFPSDEIYTGPGPQVGRNTSE